MAHPALSCIDLLQDRPDLAAGNVDGEGCGELPVVQSGVDSAGVTTSAAIARLDRAIQYAAASRFNDLCR
jgi:hypothetical protein